MAEAMVQEGLEFYGAVCTVPEVTRVIEAMCDRNDRAFDRGRTREALVIWGKPGIGKTSLGKQLAEKDYDVIDVPLAQFEEMGDLHGMPEIVIDEETGRHVTKQALPSWVPVEPRRGVIILDDWNRADSRILKGTMQLIQDYRMVTWSIPRGYTLILTGNPDGGDYNVSTLDDAQLTRMRHVTLEADVEAWAQWATDNDVDRRGINFVLRYQEAITVGSPRTNPRTLTEFFRTLEDIPDLKAEARMVEINAMASLCETWATTFITFMQGDMDKLVEAEDILNRYDEVKDRIKEVVISEDGTKKLDLLEVMTSRVMFLAGKKGFKPSNEQIKNFQKFLTEDGLVPADKVHQMLTYINKIQSNARDSQAFLLAMDNEVLLEKVRDVVPQS